MEVTMSTGRTLSYVAAVIMILFGVGALFLGLIFIWGSTSANAQSNYITIGIISAMIGFALIGGGAYMISLAGRGKMGAPTENVTLNVDLPANVNMETMKCKSCGGSLTMDNIQMVAGAPVVNCPYCHTTYQLTEDPKW
jgi:ascorbate-specific PTS system EIIC-type component UlaA